MQLHIDKCAAKKESLKEKSIQRFVFEDLFFEFVFVIVFVQLYCARVA